MKTTNFEISKKLAEIGFKPKNEENRVWNYDGQIRWEYPAYEFETLLDALPDKITTKFKHFDTGEIKEFKETLKIDKSSIYYSHDENHRDYYLTYYEYCRSFSLVVKSWESESLADTAGRMIIELFKAGIINFNK